MDMPTPKQLRSTDSHRILPFWDIRKGGTYTETADLGLQGRDKRGNAINKLAPCLFPFSSFHNP